MRMSRCGCRGSRRSSCRGASNDGLRRPSAVVPPLPPLASGIARCRNSAWDGLSCAMCHGGPPLCRGSHDSANDRLWLKLRPVPADLLLADRATPTHLAKALAPDGHLPTAMGRDDGPPVNKGRDLSYGEVPTTALRQTREIRWRRAQSRSG